jgi:hypothetical protein
MGKWLGQIMGEDELEVDANWFYKRADWQWTFAWLPHRCDRTGQLIWLKYAYCGTVRYEHLVERMSDKPLTMERRWVTTEEWIVSQLKGIW